MEIFLAGSKDGREQCQKILDSLYFSEMDDRRNQIKQAHEKTFEWILRHHETEDPAWDDFVKWLESDGGHPIYWIRGKPGSGKSTLVRHLDRQLTKHTRFGEWTKGFS